MKKLTICLALIVIAGVACSGDDSLADMELRRDLGTVTVLRDGETINVDGRIELKPGDVITTGPNALARFALEGGAGARQGELQSNARALVVSPTSLEAQSGKVLMDVSEPTRTVVEGVTARASDAVFRIDRGFGSVRVGTYSGSVRLDAPGQSDLGVASLYQATIVAGELPGETRPYRLDERDAWDKELLGEVVQLEGDLAVLSRGLANQLGRTRPTLGYFRALVDGGDVSFMPPYLRRPAPDLLIGFTIARNADGPLERAFESAFDLHDDGARWGIAAMILEVEPRPIVAQLERLILGTQVLAADGTSNPAQFTVAAAAAASGGGAGTSSAPPSGGTAAPPSGGSQQPPSGGGGGNQGGGNSGNRPPNEPPPPDECQSTAECAVQDVEDQLPGPQPSPSPTEEEDKRLLGVSVDV
jgi:hypothetical protein